MTCYSDILPPQATPFLPECLHQAYQAHWSSSTNTKKVLAPPVVLQTREVDKNNLDLLFTLIVVAVGRKR
jgi:hypothetical protein